MAGLRWIWTSHRGDVWDLTSGSRGVVLSEGQAGFQWHNFSHVWSEANHLHRGVKEENLELDLKVDIGWNLLGQDRYEKRREWWRSTSPFQWGTLRCIAPDGSAREAQFRLRESPATVFANDPGMGYVDDSVEVWPLVSDSPWWYSPWISVSKESTSAKALWPASNPIFNVDGQAWPVQVGNRLPDGFTSFGSGTSSYYVIENLGDAPLYPTYELEMSYSGVRFGLMDMENNAQGISQFERSLKPEEKVTVYTDPREPMLVSNGGVMWADLKQISFVGIQPGKKMRLIFEAQQGTQSYTSAWRGKVFIRHQYAMPF